MAELTRLEIDGEHYVARYAQNRLSESEREAFEDYCVLHPEFASQVSTDRVLIRGLRGLEETRSTRPAPPWRRYAIAASIIAALALTLGVLFRQPGESGNRLFAANADLPRVLALDRGASVRLVRARGGYVPEVRVPSGAAAVEVNLVPGAKFAPPWQATLALESDGTWREIGSASVATANPQGGITLIVDVRDIEGGLMRLTLQDKSGSSESFEFRLSRPGD